MADLKSGTTIGGNTIWSQANLPLLPTGNTLTYKGFKVYTENDKPTKAEIGLGNVTNDAQVKKSGDEMTGDLTLKNNTQLTVPRRINLVADTAGNAPYLLTTRSDNNAVTDPFPSQHTRTFTLFVNTKSNTSDPAGGANLAALLSHQSTTGAGSIELQAYDAPNKTTGATGILRAQIGLNGWDGSINLSGASLNVGMSTTVSGNLTGTQLITKGDGNRNVEFRDAGGNELAMIFADTGKNLYVRSGGSYVTRFAADGTLILANGLTAPRQIFVNGAGLPANNSLIRLDTSSDGNASGDGATHLGVKADDGKFYHYFRGAGTMFIDVKGGISSSTPLYMNGVDPALPKIEMLSTGAAGGKNLLRRFRGGLPDMIWHETIQGTQYRLMSGATDSSMEFFIDGNGLGRGGAIYGGTFTADAGNDGFKIRYKPATESAMFQIWNRDTSVLNSYFGYGSSNQATVNLYNRLGDIAVSTPNAAFRLDNTTLTLGNSASTAVSQRAFTIRNWGDGGFRAAVFEVNDGTGYHFYSQRRSDNLVEVAFSGDLYTNGILRAQNNIIVRGSDGVSIQADTNCHVWFRNSAGAEKAVLYAENNGSVKLRTSNQQYSLTIADGMILATGQPTTADSRGLIRGAITGGAWVDWRNRPAGLLVDCQDSYNQAYNIWKATHWGVAHLAAMGVHNGSGAPTVGLHVGGADYWWDSAGTFNAAGNGSFNDVYIRSDIRLKSNLVELKDALSKVEQLKGYIYDKKQKIEDDEPQYREAGIIAQDLQKVLPEAVSEHKDTGILTISPSSVNALLVTAINELRERLEAIERKIGA
ncbi:long tail fiber protein distal subunit [Citrobacter phage vB_CfrM_CfP1]|uniref:Long tail fiber protein Gp37 n=1 Tax=Citrobacter phage vB_CfrM_CfP1 TaxID=1871313 RepID=A0A1B1IX78_9CAUD|nr:long tail fiber protein distal subunit [Citrobacter phage vB_CfrM_CfP1]ANS05924.1 large distal tail fiber subunit [Citrobacter phage vB_CfrM_CfP1]